MVRLLDSLDRAQGDPEKDIHFALELGQLFNSIERDEDLDEDTQLHLEEMEGEYLLPDLVEYLTDWYGEEEFESAREALSLLEDGIDDAVDNNWLQVATQYHHRLISLKAGLAGHDVSDEIDQVLDYLERNYHSISLQFIISVIEIVFANLDDVSASDADRWEQLIKDIAASHRSANRFDQQREYLRLLRRLKVKCEESTDTVEEQLIDSYRDEADLAATDSDLRKSDILQSGVSECSQYMNDATKREWKQEALQARRRGSQNELTELSLDDLDVDGFGDEDLEEAVFQEMEELTQVYVDWFKGVKETWGSSTYALYCLALSRSPIPDPNRIRLSTEQYVFSELVQRNIISPEAHTYSVDPSDVDTIPSSYSHAAATRMSSLGNALYQLMKEGHLSATDFIALFRIGNSLSPDTEAFITDGLFDLFNDNHVQALFVLVPHLEAVIVDTLESIGRPAYTITEQGTQQQLLGGLFIEGSDLFGSDYAMYLRYRYTSREGTNLRNRLSHGQLRYRNAIYLNSVLTLFDIVKCMICLNISPYLERFTIPNRTLSPSTHYNQPTDLSLFTDLNKQIVGYGRSEDGHSILVLREDRHNEVTELFLDKGRIERYRIDGVGHSREELRTKIDQLREDHPIIPEEINHSWLDRDDLILEAIMEIIEEEIDSDSRSLNKEMLFEKAKTRGIDESRARLSLRLLEEDGVIEQAEDTVSLS
ncbi:DUF4209 domain-containing protein [Natronococcus wangiae]|uniref:DUF4209 domain-containing protein n=1 Tax=Natronococcus wangiae TaxID=3068275 RepID=UPI00273FD2C5|nr:DUF4209 domain-containing protein [Natronococcus sp. AD5]